MINKEKFVGLMIALGGMALFSCKAILAKLAYQYEGVNAESILLLRMGFSLPFYIMIALWQKVPQRIALLTSKDHISIIVLGVLGYYLASFFDFKGLEYVEANIERLILFAYPTIVVVLSAIFLKKKIKGSQYVALGLTYLGIVIVFYEQLNIETNTNFVIGAFFVFLSALTYAFYLVGSGVFLPKIGTVVFTTYSMLVSTVCVCVHYFVVKSADGLILAPEVYLIGAGMALFCTVIPTYMISEAINRIDASTISIVSSLGPVMTIALSNVVLGEILTPMQAIGATIIIAGVVWVSLKK